MGVLSWIVMGFIVGLLAKFIMPGKDPGGLIITILLGIAGAFVGGYVGSHLGLGTVTGFNGGSLWWESVDSYRWCCPSFDSVSRYQAVASL